MKQYGTENEAVRSKMCQTLADQWGVYQSIFKKNRQTAAKTLLGRVISTSEGRHIELKCCCAYKSIYSALKRISSSKWVV